MKKSLGSDKILERLTFARSLSEALLGFIRISGVKEAPRKPTRVLAKFGSFRESSNSSQIRLDFASPVDSLPLVSVSHGSESVRNESTESSRHMRTQQGQALYFVLISFSQFIPILLMGSSCHHSSSSLLHRSCQAFPFRRAIPFRPVATVLPPKPNVLRGTAANRK